MSKMNKLCNQLRLQYVKRWHVVHQTHDQSVAEHSLNTAFIARRLATEVGLSWHKRNEAAVAAMFHDIDEVITGDIPGPFKKTIPDEVFGAPSFGVGDDEIEAIVKLADMMETTWHVVVHSVTPHALAVADNCVASLHEALEQCPWPELADAGHKVWGEMLNGEYDFV